MGDRPKVLMIITLDTKAMEAQFVRTCLEDCGLEVYHLDPSVRSVAAGSAEITPDQIAAALGKTMPEVRALNHEAKCLEIMTAGAIKCAQALHQKAALSGIIGVGGSLGTDVATAVMRSFPFGLPKVMVSTMASGMTRPFVGTKDIMMVPSICDVAGLNAVTRRVFQNSALALAGMAHGYKSSVASGKPMIALSTLGTTEKTCGAIRKSLEQRGFEVMVFHTQGIGGVAMDETVREQEISVAINLSLIEVGDFLCQGLFSGGADRCKASLEKGIPTIFAPGNIDFMVAGPIEDANVRFPGRRYHIHNPQLTAVRAGAEEFRRIAEHMAGLIRDAKGPVAFFIPLLGFSAHDSEQGHLHDPSLPPVFAEHLQKVMPGGVPVTVLPYHINDERFAAAITEQAMAFQKKFADHAERRESQPGPEGNWNEIMSSTTYAEVSWERMSNAIENVRRRLLRAAAVLAQANIPYAVAGGNAVAAWVSRVDDAAVRNTQDVDIVLRRADLSGARQALEQAGFVYKHEAGMDMFLDGPDAKARDAVHIVFAAEKVLAEYASAAPDVSESEETETFRLLSLDALVRMKLTSFRDKDRVHLRDLMDVGLVDKSWLPRVPAALRSRLQELLDNPEG